MMPKNAAEGANDEANAEGQERQQGTDQRIVFGKNNRPNTNAAAVP
jgi:hypothetical protein